VSKSDVEPPIERIRGELRAAAERARHQAPEFPRRVPKQVELQPEIAPIVQTDAHAGATVQSTVANVTGVVQLGQLSQFHGAAFVRNAYLALLGREADETAVKTQMALLGRGISKIEIMGNLRWSAEGRFKAVSVPGLWPRYLLQKATHVPILGYVLQLAMGLAGLPAIVRHQRAADALHVTRADAIEQATHALDARLQSQAEEAARLRVDHDALQVRAAAAESALAQLSEAIQATSGLARQSNQQMLGMNHWLASLRHSLAEIERLAECKGRERAVPLAGITDGLLAADASRSARLDQWLEQFRRRLARCGGCARPGWCRGLAGSIEPARRVGVGPAQHRQSRPRRRRPSHRGVQRLRGGSVTHCRRIPAWTQRAGGFGRGRASCH
jgi:hypothetical protein